MVSTRTRQAAAFGAFRREGVESCRWGAFGAFFGAFSQVGGSPVGGAQLDRPRGVLAPYPSSERLRRVWPRSLDAAIGRRMGVARVLEVFLPLSSTRRPSVEACTTKNAIVVRSARDETRHGQRTAHGGGGRWGAHPRDWVVAAATHTRVATALGAGNWRAGMGGGVHVRGHACGQPCGLAIWPLELTSATWMIMVG